MRAVLMMALLVSTSSDHWGGTLTRLEEARIADADQRAIELGKVPMFCVNRVEIVQPVCNKPEPNSATCTYVRREIVRPGCPARKPEKVEATLTLDPDGQWQFEAP